LQQEWRRLTREQSSLALILCDIDFFKLYNDTYGHQMGDDCLRQVAQTINQAARRPADVVARYGGEEFAVILPNTTAENAMYVAESIRREVQALGIPHANSPVHSVVTLSLGVSGVIPTEAIEPEQLIAVTDRALYTAKQQGRNRVILGYLDP
jgi:diguanylate cyclase (GGDEF)-like protein